jgi:hypothetical protein
MPSLKKSRLVALLAAAAVACTGATPVAATTLDGGAFTLTATQLMWSVHGSLTFFCADSSITGTTPAGSASALLVPVTLSYNGCNVLGAGVSVTPSEGCHTAATSPLMMITQNQVVAPQASVRIILPAGCNIDLSIPATACTMTITGGQVIGNGTTGVGGIGWTNLAPKSTLDLTQALVTDLDSNGGGAIPCPTAGTHSATVTGAYKVTSATNVTVTP